MRVDLQCGMTQSCNFHLILAKPDTSCSEKNVGLTPLKIGRQDSQEVLLQALHLKNLSLERY